MAKLISNNGNSQISLTMHIKAWLAIIGSLLGIMIFILSFIVIPIKDKTVANAAEIVRLKVSFERLDTNQQTLLTKVEKISDKIDIILTRLPK